MELFQITQTIFTAIGALAAIGAVIVALYIGIQQNRISSLQDYAEVFLMPQQLVIEDTSGKQIGGNWVLLIKNASSYPIYINSYTINGLKTDVGNTAVPNNADSWYGAPITPNVQTAGQFSVLIEFEDYRGKKYSKEGFGKFNGVGWEINSEKRVERN